MIKATETDILEKRKQLQKEREEIQSNLTNITNELLFSQALNRIGQIDLLLEFINKELLGE